MLTTKIFIRKNRAGNFLKNIREHYLRDDIHCGISNCHDCPPNSNISPATHENKCSLYNFNHYLVLDTNVILHQMDLLEEDAMCNVIILNTVLEEVKHRNLPIYKRLNNIMENTDRNFYLFPNNFHIECYIAQDKLEVINDYNDRCIRRACTWYMQHVPDAKFVLLTDDVANRQLAAEENIYCCSVENYVAHLENCGSLQDKLAHHDGHSISKSDDIFPPHLTTLEIHKGIKENKLYQGVYHASRDNFLEGYVVVEESDGTPMQIIVQGRVGQNRAVQGDVVAVELFNVKEWTAPSDLVFEDEGLVESGVDEVLRKEAELNVGKGKKEAEDRKPTGRVVGVIRRKWRQYCGILQQDGDASGLYQLFVPAEKRVPKIRIQTRQGVFLRTQKIVVTIDLWPRHSRYPEGHFVRALGAIGDQATENEVVLLEHEVPHNQFSEQVLKCLPKLPWIITDADVEARVDLRDIDICSVDPPGCTDIDDALHCRPLTKDTFEVGVHIADVSHFIRPGTALDVEAANRATTVYLVNKRIDMVSVEIVNARLHLIHLGSRVT
uniref:Protein DIS3 homolog n=1 Tax=Photinus pyralis TaxID=7054 RepID=A0A1Y1LIX1_PHOPY